MEKAIIIYKSMKGTTEQFSHEIADLFTKRGIQSKVTSVENYRETDLSSYDYIFLGCWTKGLMFFAQHPDDQWQKFVEELSLPDHVKIGLFTTYKIAVGSMFSRMVRCLPEDSRENVLTIKSRNRTLPVEMITKIEDFIN